MSRPAALNDRRATGPDGEPLPSAAPLSQAAALFLDLDGTLAALAPRPDDVGPDPARSQLLRRLSARLGGALAVVTGRTLADADRILDGAVPAVGGVHGLCRRTHEGQVICASVPPILAEARARAQAFAAERPGLLVEDKQLSLALHYRAAPAQADEVRAFARSLAADGELQIQEGILVVELRPPGPDKGAAIRAFLAEPPFAGRLPVFVGDDLTDEAGFAAALALGGRAIVVGERRPTLARETLADVPAVLAWLAQSLELSRA